MTADYGYGYETPSSIDYGYGYEAPSSIDYGYGYGVSSVPSMTPTHTTTWVTESTTMTSWITGTPTPPACPHGEIIKPIESLNQCSQSIVFECLASSKCNTCDFACICAELKHLNIEGKISDKCSPADKAQYMTFQSDVCNGVIPPPKSPSSIIVSTSTPPVKPSTTPGPLPPAMNSTVVVTTTTAGNATTTVPVKITSTQTIVSTDKQGKPTTVQSVIVVPATPTGPAASAAPPAPPAYTGAAASMKMGAFASAVGFLGLVFAGL